MNPLTLLPPRNARQNVPRVSTKSARSRAREFADRVPQDRRRLSIVVPMRPGGGEPALLERWPRSRGTGGGQDRRQRAGDVEVLVVEGTNPSRQRNRGVEESRGDYILFLDDDSLPSSGLVDRYIEFFARHPGAGVVGGPAVAGPAGASGGRLNRAARWIARVMTSPWIVGRRAARYSAIGGMRPSDDRELILCNLCVRSVAIAEAGGFDERLYPHEENDLIERIRDRGWAVFYDPRASVERAHRSTLSAHFATIARYGRGRGVRWRLRSARARIASIVLSTVVAAYVVALPLAVALGVSALGVPSLGVSAPAASALAASALAASALAAAFVGSWRRHSLGVALGVVSLGAATWTVYALGVVAGAVNGPRGPVVPSRVTVRRFEVALDRGLGFR